VESSPQKAPEMRAKLKLLKPAPATEMQRVRRKSDKAYGRDGHKYLTPEQVEVLVKAARQNRHGLRDALMISLAWHHGLRASELVDLRWSAIDWKRADIAVTRLKNGKDTRQPLDGGDLRSLRALYRDRSPTNTCSCRSAGR
jgi:integrase